jgi:hypothetical protein
VDNQTTRSFDGNRTSARVEHELRLITDAIHSVAAGDFPSLTFAGLRFGDELLPEVRALASSLGVDVRPLFSADEHGLDLVVERRGTDER